MKNTINFKFDGDKELVLTISDGAFTPTATTSELVKAVHKYTKTPGKVLDLGCGIGVTGLALNELGLVSGPLYASDLSVSAIECTKENAEKYSCPVVAKHGSIFEPWAGEKFDYIVNDISGIAKKVADISPWFIGVSCDSGADGVSLVAQVLKQASQYLNKNGKLFFPVISLSSVDKIISSAKENFKNVEMITRGEWPLPKEMYAHKDLLYQLRESGDIQFSEKFGMIICYTDICVAY